MPYEQDAGSAAIAKLTPKEVLAKVKKIEITTKKLVDGLLAGNYHSVFKGNGIEFAEIREYRPGDDIRTIDWNVTARFDKPFVKEFIEERDLRVYVALDISASGNFGTRTEKRTRAIETAATIFFSAVRNSDKAGLFMFSDSLEVFIPARKGRKHILKMISKIISHTPESKSTDLLQSLSAISSILKKRSVLFIISDFIMERLVSDASQTGTAGSSETPTTEFMRLRKILRLLSRKHDVIAVRLYDTHELEIPDIGMVEFEDEETGEQLLLDTSDPEFREAYHYLTTSYETALEKTFKATRTDSLALNTEEPLAKPLMQFFKMRRKRVER